MHAFDRQTDREMSIVRCDLTKLDAHKNMTSCGIVCPFAVGTSTCMTMSIKHIQLIREVSRHVSTIAKDRKKTTFLSKRLSMALQRGNAGSTRTPFHMQESIWITLKVSTWFSISRGTGKSLWYFRVNKSKI